MESRTREIKKMQAHLIQTEKMSSLGRLVSSVAHEINNPTAFMVTAAFNLKRNLENFKAHLLELAGNDLEPDIRAYFDNRFASLFSSLSSLEDGTDRISKRVGDLRMFYRQDKGENKKFSLYEGLQATINLAKPHFNDVTTFAQTLQGDPLIEGHRDEINQVFMNLIVNGCEAIGQKQEKGGQKEKGNLTISTWIEGDHVNVCFQDNGVGMSREVQYLIFEPFYTTKFKGTGLGLSISYEIVKRHNGSIDVHSEEGKGTTITVQLPLVSGIDSLDQKRRKPDDQV